MHFWFIILLLCGRGASEETPKSIIVFARHGARFSFLQPNHGTLTQNGTKMMYLLGLRLKEKYPDLLSGPFDSKRHRAVASGMYRTILSALALLQGIFDFGTMDGKPLKAAEKFLGPPWKGWASESQSASEKDTALPHGAQVFPLHSHRFDHNYIFDPYPWSFCPQNLHFPPEAFARIDRFVDLFNSLMPDLEAEGIEVSRWLKGGRLEHIQDWYLLYDIITALKTQGQLQISEFNYERLAIMFSMGAIIYFEQEPGKLQFFSGFLLKRIEAQLKDVGAQLEASDPFLQTFSLFLGHDINILSFLVIFGQTSYDCLEKWFLSGRKEGPCFYNPPFSSAMVFEIHQGSDANIWVDILLNEKKLEICPERCSLENLLDVLDDNIHRGSDLEVLEAYCFMQRSNSKKNAAWGTVFFLTLSSVLAILLFKARRDLQDREASSLANFE